MNETITYEINAADVRELGLTPSDEVEVSRGYLAKLCNGIISASLADGYNELKQAIPDQP